MKIHSIEDLIKLLDKIGPPKSGYTRFFRGHSDKTYKLEPSIYRNKGLIRNESSIIRDAIVSSPDDFNTSMSLFETLVKLQHYGYPTRLLDLTTNVLVALYFCVRNESESEGELLILDIPNEYIKYYDSDTVSILSALSFRNYNFDIGNRNKNKDFIHNRLVEDLLKYIQTYELLKHNEAIIINQNEKRKEQKKMLLDAEKYKKSLVSNFNMSRQLEEFNNRDDILKLIHDINKDKPGFMPKINSNDLKKVICVKPKLNNARIIRQQGCFLLFGINEKKSDVSKVDSSWINEEKIIILNKTKIKSELQQFGISEKILFPELESQSKEILSRYRE